MSMTSAASGEYEALDASDEELPASPTTVSAPSGTGLTEQPIMAMLVGMAREDDSSVVSEDGLVAWSTVVERGSNRHSSEDVRYE